MEEENINIFNASERPFGPLSNNYAFEMMIDGENWKTVTAYVYGQLICPAYRSEVRRIYNTKKVKNLALELYHKCIDNIVIKSVHEAVPAKFSAPNVLSSLLETKGYTIVYRSNNLLLGMNEEGKGFNILGQTLQKFREIHTTEKKNQEVHDEGETAYKIYLASEALKRIITHREQDIVNLLGKSYDEMIDAYGDVKILEKLSMPKNAFLRLYRKNILDPEVKKEIQSPGSLVPVIRKRYLRPIYYKKMQKLESILFTNYLSELDKSGKLTAQDFPSDERKKIVDRLLVLYELNHLSENLQNKIKENIGNLPQITLKDVEDAERYHEVQLDQNVLLENIPNLPNLQDLEPAAPKQIIDVQAMVDEARKNENYFENKNDTVIYFTDDPSDKYSFMSQFLYTGMFKVGNFEYPTVAHYIYESLLADMFIVGGRNEARKYIFYGTDVEGENPNKYAPLETIIATYENFKNDNYGVVLIESAKKAIDIKFSNKGLQNILLTTGDADIIYNDFSDPILGTGTRNQKGENFTGKYLMQLRDRIRAEKGNDFNNGVTQPSVIKEIESWGVKKIENLLNTSIEIGKNLTKRNHKFELDVNFIHNMINIMYVPCGTLKQNYVIGQHTQEFKDIVHRFLNNNQTGIKVNNRDIQELWEYYTVLTVSLETLYMKDKFENETVPAFLERVNKNVYDNFECQGVMLLPPIEKCSFTAIYNILENFSKIYTGYGIVSPVWNDSELGLVSKILGKEIELIRKKEIKDKELHFQMLDVFVPKLQPGTKMNKQLMDIYMKRRIYFKDELIPKIYFMIKELSQDFINLKYNILFYN